MTTDQSLVILVSELPTSTFALRLTNHPSEQTSLTNQIYPLRTSWPGQLMVQYCILIFIVCPQQSLCITVTFLTIISHLIFLDLSIFYKYDCYLSLNCIFIREGFDQRFVLWFQSEHFARFTSSKYLPQTPEIVPAMAPDCARRLR